MAQGGTFTCETSALCRMVQATLTLFAECEAWRAAEHLRKDEPHSEFSTLAAARAATDKMLGETP